MTTPRQFTDEHAPDAADARDTAADVRDTAADERDDAGDLRDDAADLRDVISGARDTAADARDAAAERRDADATLREQHGATGDTEGARGEAAADRKRASQDRDAGAQSRVAAEMDRTTSHADRDEGASERGHAEDDRGASARDREDASLDALTGAYVRGAGLLQLEREVLRSRRSDEPLTIGFVDVDGLKAINDAGGHAAGDRLLARVAAVLRDRLRPYDLVVRYGGDEFLCVLNGLTAEDAQERFRLVNVDLAGRGSVSVGVATAQPDEPAAAFIARADGAMYDSRKVPPQV